MDQLRDLAGRFDLVHDPVPVPDRLERHRRAALAGGQELLQGTAGVGNPASYRRAPSTVSTDTWVYRLWASKAMYSMAARLLSAGTLPASFRVGRSILCGPQEAQRFHAIN